MEPGIALTGLACELIESGLLDEQQIRQAQKEADRERISLVAWLARHRLVDSQRLMLLSGRAFGMPCFDLDLFDMGHAPAGLVSEKMARTHRVLPLQLQGNRLRVAVSDPANHQAISDIQFCTGLCVETVLVDDELLSRVLDRFYAPAGADLGAEPDSLAISDDAREIPPDGSEDAPAVRLVRDVLLRAVKEGASDLHFEPHEKYYRIRCRTDGLLYELARPPMSLASRISTRLKVMAGMDIAERRRPQDGRARLDAADGRPVDMRVSTLPALWGERIVIRILDASLSCLGVDELGLEAEQQRLYLSALRQSRGLILVTGPTGSGKTRTLYSGLATLNTGSLNISTVEDPVEISLDGTCQVNINPRQGLGFAQVSRALLRQDPDVIMVGEIRDPETAEVAIKAAQTGHLVLSTLHTNSAAQTLERLRNLGIPAFNIAAAVSLIVAQRLVRRLCTCKREISLPQEVLLQEGFPPESMGCFTLFEGVGCSECRDGYRGRTGIHEVVRITPELQQLIMRGGNSIEMAALATAEGFHSLRVAGLLKVMQGVTSLSEVNRVMG
ncbi:type IV-A pilus assembly ATPase PilB [Pseudomonas sp. ABC1]|nr:type IV-A pilus assembly ATPase PilB [Pseudomonas sp. ABC1]